jgi:hypothetical protein
VSGSSKESDCKVNTFIVRSASQSTNLPGIENNVSFSIMTNNDFEISSGSMNITIQGLLCAGGCKPCGNSGFKIVCTSPECVLDLISFKEGSWILDATTKKPLGSGLYMNLTQKMIGGQAYNFSFCLINPLQGQYSPVLSIMATRANVFANPVLMDSATGRAAPLSVLGFGLANISQSSPYPGGSNVISVSFSLYSVLSLASTIVLTGLIGSTSSTQSLALKQVSPLPVANAGLWNLESQNLTVKTLQDLKPASIYTFSFTLNNSARAQYSPAVSVLAWESQNGISFPLQPFAMSTLNDTGAILNIAGFSIRTISQNSTVPGASNELGVTLQSTVQLFAGSVITIYGLLNSGTPSGGMLSILSTTNPGIFDSNAAWDRASGSLAVSLMGPILPKVNYTFAFNLLNPSLGQGSPILHVNTSWISGSGRLYLYQTMEYGKHPPFFVAGIRTKSIGQTNPAPKCNNTISITMNFFVALQHDPAENVNATIAITGLTGSNGSLSNMVSVLPDADVWWDTAKIDWDSKTGSLTLTVKDGKRLIADTNYVIEFRLANGPKGQFAPVVYISAYGQGWSVSPSARVAVLVDQGIGNNAPLLIAGFKSATALQSSSVINANNSIQLTFELFAALPAGIDMTLAGLVNSTLPTETLAIQQDPLVFKKDASWDQSKGSLIFTTALNLSQLERYTLNFQVRNPKEAQSAATLTLQSKFPAPCFPLPVLSTGVAGGDGNFAPFLIAGFSVKSIQQMDSSQGAQNMLTVRLRSYVKLVVDSYLYLDGLICNPCDCWSCCKLDIAAVASDSGFLWNGSIASDAPANFDLGIEGFSLRSWTLAQSKRLSIVLKKEMLSNVEYEFNFSFVNPICGQAGVSNINISAISAKKAAGPDFTQILSAPMTVGRGHTTPFLRNFFVLATISQSTTAVSEINNISIEFRTQGPVNLLTDIVIWGLKNSQTATGPLNVSGRNATVFSGATWDQELGAIRLLLNASIIPSVSYSFGFSLINPSLSQISPAISIAALDPVAATASVMVKGSGANAPFLIVSFVRASIRQSSNIPEESNNISVSFSVTLGIPAGSQLTISGLVGSATPDAQLSIFCTPATLMSGPVGNWVQNSGTLTFTTGDVDIVPFQLYTIVFTLANPSNAQSAVTAFISVSGPIVLSKTQLTSSSGLSAPLLVTASLKSTSIGQSTASAGVQNTLTITLTTNGFLSGPSLAVGFTIAGLSGILTAPGDVPMNISSPDEPSQNITSDGTVSMRSFGIQRTEGELTLTGQLSFKVQSNPISAVSNMVVESVLISFSLVNGYSPQKAPDVSITSPDIGIAWTALDKAAGLKAPLLIAGFLFANISQSSPSQGADNDLSLGFRVQTELEVGCILKITGLQSASQGSVSIAADDAAYTAAWSNEQNNSLLLNLTKPVNASILNTVSIRVQNPRYAQRAPAVFIEGIGKTIMGKYPVLFAPGNAAALATAGFSVRSIAQSSVSVLSVNTYMVQLSSLTAIQGTNPCINPQCTVISISGLRGTSANPVIDIVNASNVFEGSYAAGTVTLKVLGSLPSNWLYVFYFNLVNPGSGLEPAVVTIESSGSTRIFPIEMSSGLGNQAPSLVAGFYSKNVSESSSSQAVTNTITMRISFNVDVSVQFGWALYLTNLLNLGAFTSDLTIRFDVNGQRTNNMLTVDVAGNALFLPLNFRAISRGEVLALSYNITNPRIPVASPSVSIQIVQGPYIARTAVSGTFAMDLASPDSAPLFVNGFRLKQIQQSSVSASALNNITVSLQAFSVLQSGMSITISGLVGFCRRTDNVSNVTLLLLNDAARAAVSPTAVCNNTAGQLSLNIRADTRNALLFAFTVQNPSEGQMSTSVSIEARNPFMARTEMVRNGGNKAPMAIAGFITKNIGQSNISCSARNIISVTLSCFVALGNESLITISGLTGSVTLDSPILPITSDIFGPAGNWTRSTGTLVFEIVKPMNAREAYQLSFILDNPPTQQQSPPISIEVRGTEITRVRMDSAAGNSAPLIVAGFTRFSIGQQTPSPAANNTITATLALNVIIEPSSSAVITISGLTGSNSNVSQLPISVLRSGRASSGFGSTAAWDVATGTILLTVRFSIVYPEYFYQVSFVLQNPASGQDSPPVNISCGYFNLAPRAMIPAVGNQAPLLIASFMTKSIGQSTPSASVQNTITLTLITRTEFPRGAFFTLAGLDGITQPSTASLSLQRHNISSPFRDRAVWDRDRGILIATLTAPVQPRVAYVVSFVLRNPSVSQDAPSLSLQFQAPGVSTAWEVANEENNAASPLVISGFGPGIPFIGQSNAAVGELNTLSVTFRTLVPLLPGTSITLSGLFGALPPASSASGQLPIVGNLSSFVGGWGNFDSASSNLTLAVVTETARRTTYILSFNVTNPNAGQVSPTLFLEASGAITIARTELAKAPGPSSPLAVIGFISKLVGQSNPAASENNTISVTMSVFVGVGNGSSVTISGLTGAATPDTAALPVSANCSVFAAYGQWTQTNGKMIVYTTRPVAAETGCVVSFVLENPQSAQTAPDVSIEVGMGTDPLFPRVSRAAADLGPGNEAPLLIAGFIELVISQKTPSAGAAVNTITTRIGTNVSLAGTALTIAGLVGSTTPSNRQLPVWSWPIGLVAATGVWDQAAGSLALSIVREPPQTWNVEFNISNPLRGPNSPAIPTAAIFTSRPGSSIYGSKLIAPTNASSPADVNSRPLLIAGFTFKRMAQSTPSPDADNRLILTVSSQVDLPSGTNITVSGLLGSATPSNTSLALTGNATVSEGGPIGRTGVWDQSRGTLVSTVAAAGRLAAGSVFSLAFVLRNPSQGQDAPPISIEAGGAGVYTAPTSINAADGAEAPLIVSDLLLRSIGQSTPIAGAINNLTVTLATRVALPPGTNVTISGLLGASPAMPGTDAAAAFASLGFAIIPVRGNLTNSLVGGAGTLTTAGTLILSVRETTAPDEVYECSFAITNPADGQRSPSVFIEATGPVAIRRIMMEKAAGPVAPLAVAGFMVKTAGQSDSTARANNTISVTLVFFVGLGNGSAITISGLIGAITPDTAALPVSANSSVFADRGVWSQSNGTLVVYMTRAVAAEAGYSLSFVLTNPGAAQVAPAVSVEVDSGASVRRTVLEQAPGLSAPLAVAASLLDCLVQGSTREAGATSIIKLTFRIGDVVLQGDTVTLSGLNGSGTASVSPLTLSNASCSANFSDPAALVTSAWSATWRSDAGSVALTAQSGLDAGSLCTVSFSLMNPSAGQESPLLTIQGSGTAALVPQPCAVASGPAAPFLVQEFLSLSAQQSSPFPTQRSTLRILFSTRAAVTELATLVVSGLSGWPDPLDAEVRVCQGGMDRCCACVTGAVPEKSDELRCDADWDAALGRLSVVLVGNTTARSVYSVEVNTTNPPVSRPATTSISVSLESTGGSIASTQADLAGGNSAPLLVAGWSAPSLSIGQSSTAAGAVNEISVTFSANIAFVAADGVSITIAGLSGSATPAGALPVDAPALFAGSATWLATGQAVLRLVSNSNANVNYTVRLPLLNPLEGRDSEGPFTISASIAAGGRLAPTPLAPAQGDGAPLAVAGWAVQPVLVFADPMQSAATVVLASRRVLAGYFGTKITLSGMAGSSTPGFNAKVDIAPASPVFGAYARWFQGSGRLILINQREPAVAMQAYNASVPSLSVAGCLAALLAGNGSAKASFATLDAAGPLIAPAPLLVPGFSSRSAGAAATDGGSERTSPGSTNNVSVTLVPNLVINSTLIITLSGLSGTGSPSGSLQVTAVANSKTSALTAAWDSLAGALTVAFDVQVGMGMPLVLRFQLVYGGSPLQKSGIAVAATCMPCILQRTGPLGSWQLVAASAGGGGVYFPRISMSAT